MFRRLVTAALVLAAAASPAVHAATAPGPTAVATAVVAPLPGADPTGSEETNWG